MIPEEISWVNWRYSKEYLPGEFHVDPGFSIFQEWLESAPWLYNNDRLRGASDLELVALAVGLAAREIMVVQTREPDTELLPGMPQEMDKSVVEFSAMESMIQPACYALIAAIESSKGAQSKGGASNTGNKDPSEG